MAKGHMKPCPTCGTPNKVPRDWFDELNDWKARVHFRGIKRSCGNCGWTRNVEGWSGAHETPCFNPTIPTGTGTNVMFVWKEMVCDLWKPIE